MDEKKMNFIISKRLVSYMTTKNVSQMELAEYLGVSQASVSNWCKGIKIPRMDKVDKICKFFNINRSDLMGWEEPQQKTPSKKGVRVPVLGKVAAGVPIEAIEDILDYEEVPEDWTKGGKEYFGLKVQGDSMYPEYLENDIVIVLKQEQCESNQDCIIMVGDCDATLKTVILNEDGSLTLKPVNPNYPPKTYKQKEILQLPVSILGVVVELRRTKL